MSKLSKGGLVGLLYNDFNQRQKSGIWSLEDHAADQNYIRSSQIPNNYLAVGCHNTNSLLLYDMFFKTKISTNIFNIPEASIICIDYNYQNSMVAFGLNKAPYLKIYDTDTFAEYNLNITIPGAITCLRFDYTGDFLFIGYLEPQDNTHIIVYNVVELVTGVSQTNQISIILDYLPTCIKFTKDDEYLCIGHYGSIENEYNNISLYKYSSGIYEDVSEYNLNSFELQTPTDICFVEDLGYLFISSFQKPYLYCYDYDRQGLVNKFTFTIASNITSKVNSLLLTKDSKKLFIGCDIEPYLFVLDLLTNTISPFESNYITDSITSLSFSYNDQYLCVTTRDGGLKVFDYTLKTLEYVTLDFVPTTTPFCATFLLGPVIEYEEIEKPTYSVSSNDDAMVSVTSDGEITFTGSFLTDGVSTSTPDLAAHKQIFQTQIYFSSDYQNTYITSIKIDGTLITNDINIVESYNNIIQLSAYYSRILLLDRYGSVQIINNVFGTEEQYYIQDEMSKDIKQVSVGDTIVLALTNNGEVKSSNKIILDDYTISTLPSIKQVSVGDIHVSLLTESNTVLSYGDNSHAQCDTEDWTDIKKVCCGDLHTIALTNDNIIYITGSDIDLTTYDDIKAEEDVVDIFSGPNTIMIVKSDATIIKYSLI